MLIDKVSELLATARYKENCERMAARLAGEDGLTKAVDFVELNVRPR